MMKYTVELNHFRTGAGYQYSEDFDEGQTSKFFTAREWLNMLDEPIDVDPAGGWRPVRRIIPFGRFRRSLRIWIPLNIMFGSASS